MKPKYRNANLGASLVTVITVCFGTPALALDNLWTGAVGTDWNNAGNWSDPHGFGSTHVPSNGAGHPGDEDAIINMFTGNYPVVVANPTSNPRDVKVGSGTGNTGRVDHNSGTVSTGSGNWFCVGLGGGTGTYNLGIAAPGGSGPLTGLNQGSGGINANGRLYIPIDGGSNGTFNMHTTGTVAARDLLAVGDGGTGVMRKDSGTVNAGELWVGQGASGNGTFNIGAASGQIIVNNWVAIGREGADGVVNMTGGTWTKSGESNFIIGTSGQVGGGKMGVGIMNMSGGTVTVAPRPEANRGITWVGEQNNSSGVLNLSGTAEFNTPRMVVAAESGALGKIEFDGGKLRTNQLAGGSGTATGEFNGTEIIAGANEAAFVTNFDTATLESGGLVINSDGKIIGSDQIFSGTGGVTKNGAGTFTLPGAQAYTGLTAINAGKLISSSSLNVRGDFSVGTLSSSGVMEVVTSAPDDQLVIGSLTVPAAGSTLELNLGNFSDNAIYEALKINGSLVLNADLTLNVIDQRPAVGIIPLVKYTPGTRSGSGNFVLGPLPLGVNGDFVDDKVSGEVYLDVESVALPRWEGNVSSEWDFTTENWFDLVTNASSLYTDNNPVFFNDDPWDESSTAVNIASGVDVKPSQVNVNNSIRTYSITGAGKISGPGSLVKTGSAGLTVGTLNEYTGITNFSGGPVSINSLANGGVPSAIGASTAAASNFVIGASEVTYTGPSVTTNRGFTIGAAGAAIKTANDITFQGNVATIVGDFTKLGTGNLTFSNTGTNTFGTGGQALKINGGTVTFNGSGTQVNNVGGEMFIGALPNVPAHVVLNGGTLNTANWLAVGRGNGDNGSLSSLTATNSTISTVNFSTGYNDGLPNDSDQLVDLTNTIWTNNGATNLAESINSNTTVILDGTTQFNATATLNPGRSHWALGENSVVTMTIRDTAKYTCNARFQIAHGLNSSATITIEGSGGLVKTGEWTSIGNSSNGTGTLNVKDNGTFSTDGDFNISDVGTSKGYVNVSGSGAVTSTGVTFIGKGAGTYGELNMTGGTFTVSNQINIGNAGIPTEENPPPAAVGVVNITGGSLNQTGGGQALTVGTAGTGTLNVATGGAVNVSGSGGLIVGNTGNGTVNLNGGGTVTTTRVSGGAAGGTGNVYFDGGTLTAGAGANADFFSGLNTAQLKAGGLTINSGTNNIAIAQNITNSATGNITKTGTGTLNLNGNVNTGASGLVVVNQGTLGGSGVIAHGLTVNANGNVNPGNPLGTLTVQGTATFNTGSSLTIDLDASPDILAANNLVLNNTTLVLNGVPTEPVYLIARYILQSGTFSTPAPSGYEYDYAYDVEGFPHIALVQTGGGNPYATWINGFFPGETNPAIIGETADPDGDGSSNALEFALGGAPNSGTNNPKIYSLQADSNDTGTEKELILTIAVRNGTNFSAGTSPTATNEGFTYAIQGSLDLAGFTTGVSIVDPIAPASNPTPPLGYVYRSFSLNGSNGLPGKGFLRARVTKVP